MKRHWEYLKYIFIHKWYVFQACRELHVPLWIAILHDWDKFLPSQWLPYARHFYAPDGTHRHQDSIEFTIAWMKHQHRNRHHWQYWLRLDGMPLRQTRVVVSDTGKAREVVESAPGTYELRDIDAARLTADPMPDVYRREMMGDWLGAARSNGITDMLALYEQYKDKMYLHPETRAWVEAHIGYHPGTSS